MNETSAPLFEPLVEEQELEVDVDVNVILESLKETETTVYAKRKFSGYSSLDSAAMMMNRTTNNTNTNTNDKDTHTTPPTTLNTTTKIARYTNTNTNTNKNYGNGRSECPLSYSRACSTTCGFHLTSPIQPPPPHHNYNSNSNHHTNVFLSSIFCFSTTWNLQHE